MADFFEDRVRLFRFFISYSFHWNQFFKVMFFYFGCEEVCLWRKGTYFAIITIKVEPAMAFAIYIVHDKVNLSSSLLSLVGCCPGLGQQDPLRDKSSRESNRFPIQNSNSLKICWSPIGFLQNIDLISSGHLFNGKNASPFKVLKISLRCSTASFEERYRIFSRYILKAAIIEV